MNDTERERWLEDRRSGIGGSDAAAVCGASRWKTPLEVYLDKIGETIDEETQDMRRGTLLEPVVRQMYCDETGSVIVSPSEIMRNEKYPFALANFDGIVKSEIVFEGKTSRNKTGWGEPWTGEIPLEYFFQVQHYMVVSELPTAHVAVMFGIGFEFAIYEVAADPEFQSMLMEREAEFWDRVQNRVPPDPKTANDILHQYPVDRGIRRAASETAMHAVRELARVKAAIAELEAEKESLECQIKREMRDADALTFADDVIATWKTSKGTKRFDVSRFRADRKDLYDTYLIQSEPSRRFCLKGDAKCLTLDI